jgi:hypothetical protein
MAPDSVGWQPPSPRCLGRGGWFGSFRTFFLALPFDPDTIYPMAKKPKNLSPTPAAPAGRPSALVDTRVIYCGDNLDQLAKLPDHCVDLIYIDPPFNSNRNYEVFWGETKKKRAFEDRRINAHRSS